MSDRVWHSGPPPHVGWWNTATDNNFWAKNWRWWDGKRWSYSVHECESAISAAKCASLASGFQDRIMWSDYYPKNARVQRIDPRKA